MEKREERPLDRYVAAIVAATKEYDRTGDHKHEGAPVPGDCVRCNVVAYLPPYAQAQLDAKAEREHRQTRHPHQDRDERCRGLAGARVMDKTGALVPIKEG